MSQQQVSTEPELQKRFFDYYLKGEQNGWEKEPRVWLNIRRPFTDEVELGYGELIRLRTGYASVNKVFQDDDATEARGPAVGVGIGLGRLALDFSRIFFDTSNFDEPVYITLRADI